MPYKVFIIYAREDAPYLQELRGQLRPLEKAGRIKVWSDREIDPGVDWEREIIHNLDTADIILLMVSAAYYNSVYIHEKEIKYALQRHDKGEAKVLPIIVRPCYFTDDPDISRLQVLPTDGKPVTDKKYWHERDDAWLDVVAGVKRTLDLMDAAKKQTAIAQNVAAEQKKKEEVRLLEEQRLEQQAAADAITLDARAAEARAEQELLVQRRKEQAAEQRLADQKAWQDAVDVHDVPAYQAYVTRFPQGDMVREAQARIKDLKRQHAAPIPWQRYASYGGGGVVVMMLIAWVSGMFNPVQNDKPLAVAKPDTITLAKSDQFRVDTSNPKELITTEKPKENIPSSTVKPSFIFDYITAFVEGGTFKMGSPDNEVGRGIGECQHTVKVDTFNMGKYEVTQAQWKAVMGTNPSYFKNCADCPVENVSWNDVQKFIKELKAKTGKAYRLPTEAEWEFAARGGNKSGGNIYAGANDVGSVAWYGGNAQSKTHQVGQKTPNELGLYDMGGNVTEWCQDYYKAYPNFQGTWWERGDGERVTRGGSWIADAMYCRSANRGERGPSLRSQYLGFRLVSVSLQ